MLMYLGIPYPYKVVDTFLLKIVPHIIPKLLIFFCTVTSPPKPSPAVVSRTFMKRSPESYYPGFLQFKEYMCDTVKFLYEESMLWGALIQHLRRGDARLV